VKRAAFCMAAGLLAALPVRADRLSIKGGGTLEGEVLGLEGNTVRFQSQAGGGVAVIPYPMERIARVEFDFSKEEAAVLERGGPEARALLAKLWELRRPFLRCEGGDAGAVGLRFARLLLAENNEAEARQALEICDVVRAGDWDPQTQGEAARVRLSALAATGRVEDAMKEADQLADAGGAEDEALARTQVQARLARGGVAWKKAQQMEQEWPKWPLMPELREERRRLVNQALDEFLYPVVRHVELKDLCAEGLWNAAQVYAQTGRLREARGCAEEVVNYFPVADYAPKAREFLNNHPNPEKS
jgi:tetratricopeptide (TPR) repeat protein